MASVDEKSVLTQTANTDQKEFEPVQLPALLADANNNFWHNWRVSHMRRRQFTNSKVPRLTRVVMRLAQEVPGLGKGLKLSGACPPCKRTHKDILCKQQNRNQKISLSNCRRLALGILRHQPDSDNVRRNVQGMRRRQQEAGNLSLLSQNAFRN